MTTDNIPPRRVISGSGEPLEGFSPEEVEAWHKEHRKREARWRSQSAQKAPYDFARRRVRDVLVDTPAFERAVYDARQRLGVPVSGFAEWGEAWGYIERQPDWGIYMSWPRPPAVVAHGGTWVRNICLSFIASTPPWPPVAPFTRTIAWFQQRFGLSGAWREVIMQAILGLDYETLCTSPHRDATGKVTMDSVTQPPTPLRVLSPGTIPGIDDAVVVVIYPEAEREDLELAWGAVAEQQVKGSSTYVPPRQVPPDFRIYRRWYRKKMAGKSYMEIANDPEEAPILLERGLRPSDNAVQGDPWPH